MSMETVILSQNNKENIHPNSQTKSVDKGSDQSFLCQTCGKKFKSFRQLGGHTSKSHPGQSSYYNNMLKVRKERELERQAYKMAKE